MLYAYRLGYGKTSTFVRLHVVLSFRMPFHYFFRHSSSHEPQYSASVTRLMINESLMQSDKENLLVINIIGNDTSINAWQLQQGMQKRVGCIGPKYSG